MSGGPATETMVFIDALRECLGLGPLYRTRSGNVEPCAYGAQFTDGNRRVRSAHPSDTIHDKLNHRELGHRAARRVILGLGR